MINYERIIENDYEKEIYEEKSAQILEYINQFGSVCFQDIVKRIGGSERRILRLLEEMCKNNYIKYDKNKQEFWVTNGNKTFKPYYCSKCNGDRIDVEELFCGKMDILKNIWNKKPTPTFFFDQRPVNIKTTLKRVAYMLTRGDLAYKSIVLLGDDDLTSIAIALTGIPCEIVALDVDKRLIEYINDIAKAYDLKNLKAYIFNVLGDVPENLKNKFDILMTDPTPEKIPFTVFMNKSIELLKNQKSVLYTSIYSSAMEKTIALQKVITDMNLVITDIVPEFTEYKAIYTLYSENDIKLMEKYNINYDDDSICFTESLFRIEKTLDTKKIPIEYMGKDIFGKATKRVIADKNMDPVHSSTDEEYLNNVKNDIQMSSEKIFKSK